MTRYLCKNFDFCLQGEHEKDFNIIVDYDKTVGKDSLTRLNYNYRAKMYGTINVFVR